MGLIHCNRSLEGERERLIGEIWLHAMVLPASLFIVLAKIVPCNRMMFSLTFESSLYCYT